MVTEIPLAVIALKSGIFQAWAGEAFLDSPIDSRTEDDMSVNWTSQCEISLVPTHVMLKEPGTPC